MSDDRETVLEAKVDAALTLHLDEAEGDALHANIRELLDGVDGIRHVDSVTVNQAYRQEEY